MMATRGVKCGIGIGVLLALALDSAALLAADAVTVTNAWVRATAPGQKTAAAYFDVTSSSDAALVAVGTPSAGKVELHRISMDGGVMKMRPVARIDLPARTTVKLAPGGLHVMLIGIKQPLKEGDKVPLSLSVEGAGGAKSKITIEADVRTAGSSAEHQHH